MRPAKRDQAPTVAEAVRDAARACDPEEASTGVAELVESLDDDRPATAVEDLRGELLGAAEAIDPDRLEPEVAVTAATAVWLATNPRDADRPEHAIREGARLCFAGEAPEPVARWLESRLGGS